MKVLVTCHGLWPQTPVGGMERNTYSLCRGLHQRGIEVTCAVPTSQISGDEAFPTLGFRWPEIKPWLLANRIFSNNVHRHLLSHSYDVVVSMGFGISTWRPPTKSKLIFHAFGLNAFQEPRFDPRWWWMRRMTKDLARNAACTIAESRHIQELLLQEVRMKKKFIRTIPPGVTIPKHVENKIQEPPLLLFVGRFSPEKGIDQLLELPSKLKNVNYRLCMVGSGPLEKKIKSFDHPNIQVLSPQTEGQLQKLYQQADALLLPSRSEGIPQVALEALSYGVPLIVRKVGGLIDLIDEQTVYGFSANDAESFSKTIQTFLKLTSEERQHVAKRARERAKRSFSVDRFVDDYVKLFSELNRETFGTKLRKGTG